MQHPSNTMMLPSSSRIESASSPERACDQNILTFRQLKAWQKSHQLALNLYRITASFPRTESYGLTAQIRRAGASIPSNIAEGCGRSGDTELARFCDIARGSASELEYQLLLARDLKLIQPDDYEQLVQQATDIKRMLTVFVRKLRAES
jgi:four helix bundle protein